MKMKTQFFMMICMFICISCSDDKVSPILPDEGENRKLVWNGTGTISDPYQITTPAELNNIRNEMSAHYKLMNDIDLSDWITSNSPTIGWASIGNVETPFSGTLDGGGHIISGFWINQPEADNVGLFGCVYGTSDIEIKNLGILIDKKGITGSNNIGSIIGYIHNNAATYANVILRSIFVKGDISGKDYVGGIIGRSIGNLALVDTYADGTVTGSVRVGGLVSGVEGDTRTSITNCYAVNSVATDPVSGNNILAGGIIASAGASSTDVSSAPVIISGCLAANRSIIGGSAARIIGWSKNTPTLNNLACKGTLINNEVPSSQGQSNKNGLSKTVDELSDIATYSEFDWDFGSVWKIGNGSYPYPILRCISQDKQPNETIEYKQNTPVNGGTGTISDPYQITVAEDLDMVRNNLSSHFKLMNDIDLSEWIALNSPSTGWTPLGNAETPFSGTFDGNGHVISGLWINLPDASDVGLFGRVYGTTSIEIKNLGVIIDEKGIIGSKNVGGIVGYVHFNASTYPEITLQSVFVQGKISGSDYVGGIIGRNVGNLTLTNAYVGGSITGTMRTGGLVATTERDTRTSITNCYVTNSVETTSEKGNNILAGGIIASTGASSTDASLASVTITGCFAANKSIIGGTANRIVGWSKNPPTLSNLAYDGIHILSNGVSPTSQGVNHANGLSKTLNELSDVSTYSDYNWDFVNIWQMVASYPYPILKSISIDKQPSASL